MMTSSPASSNAYEILGLGRDATLADVRNTYRKLAMRHHPDMVADDRKEEAAALFTRITKAYEILEDEEIRRRYDHLLDRGVLPDLDHEVGEVPQARSLDEIVGGIYALDIDADQNRLLADVDSSLQTRVLLPGLYRNDAFQERILDVVRFQKVVESQGIKIPPGTLKEGWLVLTDLRVIALMKFEHVYETGNVKHTDVYFANPMFLFISMKDFAIHERGRVSAGQSVEVVDEEGQRIRVDFPVARSARLLLVASAYRLPLKVRVRADRKQEFRGAFLWATSPLIAWCVPFVLVFAKALVVTLLNGSRGPSHQYPVLDPELFRSTYDVLTGLYLTATAFYLTPLLVLGAWLRLDRAWNVNRAEFVFGALAVDYALGSDAVTQAREGGGPLAESYVPPDDLALGWLSERLRNEPRGAGNGVLVVATTSAPAPSAER
jgi:hypothetical protein